MADSGESPEAPQPREMIDLEVSGITNTRMIGSIYITTMLVIKLNWKNAQQKHKIKLQAVQTIWNQKKISTMKCDPFTIDWLTSHCEAALRQEQQQKCKEIDIFYRIRFFLLFLLSAYSLFDTKKKHIWLTIDTISFIIFLFSSLFLSLVVCIFHLMWLCFLTPFVVAIGNIWKTGKWIARSQSECRSIEAKLFGAHRIAAYSAQNTGVLRWGKSTHKSNSKRNKINE